MCDAFTYIVNVKSRSVAGCLLTASSFANPPTPQTSVTPHGYTQVLLPVSPASSSAALNVSFHCTLPSVDVQIGADSRG